MTQGVAVAVIVAVDIDVSVAVGSGVGVGPIGSWMRGTLNLIPWTTKGSVLSFLSVGTI